MDSNKRAPEMLHRRASRFRSCHVSSLQALDRRRDDSGHTKPFTSIIVYLLMFKMLCETFDLHHRSVWNLCLVQVYLLLVKIQYFITFFPSHANSWSSFLKSIQLSSAHIKVLSSGESQISLGKITLLSTENIPTWESRCFTETWLSLTVFN